MMRRFWKWGLIWDLFIIWGLWYFKSFTPGFLALLLLFLSIPASDFLAFHRPWNQLRRCRYEQALGRLRPYEEWNPSATTDFVKASVLFYAGRDAEAEPVLKDCLRNPVSTGRHLRTAARLLTSILIDQHRF